MNNNGYKTIKGSGLINIEFLILILVDLFLIIQLKTGIINTIIIVVVFSGFDLLLIYSRFYFFTYRQDELIIDHLWFGNKKTFKVNDLASVELKRAPYNGKAVMVTKKSGKKRRFGANTIKREELDEMINYLAKQININK